ncbi:MAG: hypothetical protein HC881_22780 [Leptolyngbyaceae cyanobacterium SL_7_1]|nr:hypothetical protein [Leptolyngbyaceae cyanobacterium SL_7_1]
MADNLFAGGGETGAALQAYFLGDANGDGGLPLGTIATCASLRTAIRILLDACSPAFLVWGSDRILFYNDAYAAILNRNNGVFPLGQSIHHQWTEEWTPIRSDIEQVFTTGRSVQRHNLRFPPYLDPTTPEQSYTWSYSPLQDEASRTDGVFVMGYGVFPEAVPIDSPPSVARDRQPLEDDRWQAEHNPEQRALEAALAAQEQRYRYIFEAVSVAIWEEDFPK